jgi:adenine/guanine phosphoribosyltransferase-like PRPP-binding protein
VLIDEDGVRSFQAVEPAEHGALCIFEFFYLARPDTRLDGVEVHGARLRMGERLAAEAPVEADLVLPIPDSGTPAAIGFSRATGIPFSEGLIKNRYVGRTFIQPDQGLREQGVKLKFNPLAEVAGKRVVAVDDSIVRGNTTRKIVELLFEAGAAEVHVRVSAPAGRRAVLLRDRPGRRGRDDRLDADGRADPRAQSVPPRSPISHWRAWRPRRAGRRTSCAAPASRGTTRRQSRVRGRSSGSSRPRRRLRRRPERSIRLCRSDRWRVTRATARGRGSPSRSRG